MGVMWHKKGKTQGITLFVGVRFVDFTFRFHLSDETKRKNSVTISVSHMIHTVIIRCWKNIA